MVAQYITVVPAYGRDYKSKAAIMADWKEGKDFQIATFGPDDGRYCSSRDTFPAGTVIMGRYKRLEQITKLATY